MGNCCTKPISPKQNLKPVDPVDVKTSNQTTAAEKQENQQEIANDAAKYPIYYESQVKDVAMLDRKIPPLRELPTREWLKKVLEVLKELFKNSIDSAILRRISDLEDHIEGRITKDADSLMNHVGEMFGTAVLTSKDSKDDSNDMEHAKNFEELKQLLVGLPQPETIDELSNDFAFARLRIAGYVPFSLRKVSAAQWEKLNLKDYSGVCGKLKEDTNAAYTEDRLYAADYSIFEGLEPGEGKTILYPTALFQIPKDEELARRAGVTVLCIQLQTGNVESTFGPNDETWSWNYAKLMFNMAESNYHEGVAHLADTHLVVEALCLSMHHSLAETHPVYVLLKEHFFGTVFINWAANAFLVTPGGPVDELLTPTVADVNKLVSKSVLSSLASDLSFPAKMKEYGLDEESFKCTNYPYREDAKLIWEATLTWVTKYVNVQYKDDAAIGTDRQLQSFRDAMIDLGKIEWVRKEWPRGGGTKEFLSKLLASFIFIASTQHAAVNFPQKSMMAPTNVVPLGNYAKFTKPGDCTEEQTMLALPPIPRANLAKQTLYLLGGVHYTTLGDYEEGTFAGETLDLKNEFQTRLGAIEELITSRNIERVDLWKGHNTEVCDELAPHWAYTTLLPTLVPQSINI
eukprot:TRINITY_DN33875_c0_g1_i1.p1 TRINITY_DN33875_c0_g1~~TRINITY_DN33875_c0_g1_i1.p1  ORF type:complete len:630 (+),score=182.35 TRINITY_DN33875_c0_g1_i1:54-1943(+)